MEVEHLVTNRRGICMSDLLTASSVREYIITNSDYVEHTGGYQSNDPNYSDRENWMESSWHDIDYLGMQNPFEKLNGDELPKLDVGAIILSLMQKYDTTPTYVGASLNDLKETFREEVYGRDNATLLGSLLRCEDQEFLNRAIKDKRFGSSDWEKLKASDSYSEIASKALIAIDLAKKYNETDDNLTKAEILEQLNNLRDPIDVLDYHAIAVSTGDTNAIKMSAVAVLRDKNAPEDIRLLAADMISKGLAHKGGISDICAEYMWGNLSGLIKYIEGTRVLMGIVREAKNMEHRQAALAKVDSKFDLQWVTSRSNQNGLYMFPRILRKQAKQQLKELKNRPIDE